MSLFAAQRFSAKIYKLGINPCVDVPKRISRAFGQKGYVPVKGRLAGQPIRATLAPMGGAGSSSMAICESGRRWDHLRPSRQKEILLYLNWLTQPESLKRNVDKVMANLGKGTK